MAKDLPFFDFDQLADNIRTSLRIQLRDHVKLAEAITFAEGEAFVGKLTSSAMGEARRMLERYHNEIETLVDGDAQPGEGDA